MRLVVKRIERAADAQADELSLVPKAQTGME
jgi:hypothetical protein